MYTYVDKYDGNPNLLGYMVNIGGWHWIAVSARVGCPDGEAPYFVIDSMKKKSWYIKNCSDVEALKKFFTKAINEANGKEGEDVFGES